MNPLQPVPAAPIPPDEAIGIAILCDPDPRPAWGMGQYGYLHFVAKKGTTGKTHAIHIPIVHVSEYKAAQLRITTTPLWCYRIEGEFLHCQPSVLQNQGDPDANRQWHNTYDWKIKFVRYESAMPDYMWHALKMLNPDLLHSPE